LASKPPCKGRFIDICLGLRLHPAQPSNSRIASKDTILPTGGGPDGQSPVFVPKGSMVHFAAFALHRRPDLWGDDAEEFRPERWVNEKQSWVREDPSDLAFLPDSGTGTDQRQKFIPFLKGPRNCIGSESFLLSFQILRIMY
jgi:cytochrome P450